MPLQTATLDLFLTEMVRVLFPFLHHLIALFFFTAPLRKRERIASRYFFAIIGCLLLIPVISAIRLSFPHPLVKAATMLLINGFLLFLLIILFKEDRDAHLLIWCGAAASEKLAVQILRLSRIVRGYWDTNDILLIPGLGRLQNMIVYFLIYTALIAVLYFLFGRNDLSEQDEKTKKQITTLSLSSTLALVLFSDVIRQNSLRDPFLYGACLALLCLVCLLILFIRNGITVSGRYRQELQLMTQMIEQERKQYEMIRGNLDYINMKCHDIKHQLSRFQGRLTESEINLLKEAVDLYDASVKTGNEVLDVVVYEMQMLCKEKDISFSCLADGRALTFLSRTHLYSLLHNALGNALEAAETVEEPDKRIISLTTEHLQDQLVIGISNYFSRQPVIEGSSLLTSKKDTAHHGLGIRSMQYITSLYK